MYIPQSFAVTDKDLLNRFIHDNAFAQLTSRHQGRLFSTHLPFLYDSESDMLVGHVAKANPQHQDIEGQEVLVTFQGPHGYISPTWYATNGVPTWNYQALHIYGQCKVFTQTDRLKTVVDSLADMYERQLPNPWVPNYQANMLKGIVGLEIKVTGIEGKFKLNQNRSPEDMQGVIDHLDPTTQGDLLQAMQLMHAAKTKPDST